MSVTKLKAVNLSEDQIEDAVRRLQNRVPMAEVRVYRPFTMPENLRLVQINGRNEMEMFILFLSMIVSGDALVNGSSSFPTVVDADDILDITEFFRDIVEELENDDVFLLTLRLGV